MLYPIRHTRFRRLISKSTLALIFIFISVAVGFVFPADGASGGHPLYFVVSLMHTLSGEKLKQQVEVEQDSSFTVVTIVGRVRWTVSGKVGTLRDGEVPVDLTVKYYVSEKQNETQTGVRQLPIDKEGPSGGAIHGVQIASSIWTKPRE